MNSSTNYLSFIIPILIISFVSCGQHKTEWQGTIEEVDGVTVVKNPKEPMYGDDVFSLEEELSIGEQIGREEYIFSNIVDVGVDDAENVYIVDSKEASIKIFTKKAEYLSTLGKKGQGPGEMQSPQSIHFTPQEEIMINDWGTSQLLFFTYEGKFLKGISTARLRNLINPQVDSKGNIIANYSIFSSDMKSELQKFDSNLEPIKTIHNIELFKLPVMNPFLPGYVWQVLEEDKIMWGVSTKYELKIMSSEGELLKKIIKDYVPVEITEKDKQERKKFMFGDGPLPQGIKIEWPKYHLPFMNLSRNEKGMLFLGTFEKAQDGTRYYYDVFDSEGRYIAKLPLNPRLQVWKKNRLYTIEENDDGYQYVKRYKVTWNF
jgi:hypothetical protein